MIEARTPAALPAQFAATDMLHRRVSLPCHFHAVLGKRAVRIKTDSRLIGKAIRCVKLPTGPIPESAAVEWEIGVEIYGEPSPLSMEATEDQIEAHWFGPSCSFRMDHGSWFAHTPPSLNGVGFAMVTGDECNQVRQLATFLRAIQRFVADSTTQSTLSTECEVLG